MPSSAFSAIDRVNYILPDDGDLDPPYALRFLPITTLLSAPMPP